MTLPSTGDHLAALAELGGYFALPHAHGREWQPLPRLFDDAVLRGHVTATRDAIAGAAGCPPGRVPVRMAASSFQLGVAARLLSPAIGAAVCFGAVPVLDAGSIRWRSSDGHAPLFAAADPAWVTTGAPAATIAATVIAALTTLGDRLHSLVSLSPQVTRGNLTSAANGAVTVLAMTRPDLEPAGRTLVRGLLDTEPLAATGSFTDGTFRRTSCCLFYQGPMGGLCGDCVLTAPPAR